MDSGLSGAFTSPRLRGEVTVRLKNNLLLVAKIEFAY
jgi:hypothetical protein